MRFGGLCCLYPSHPGGMLCRYSSSSLLCGDALSVAVICIPVGEFSSEFLSLLLWGMLCGCLSSSPWGSGRCPSASPRGCLHRCCSGRMLCGCPSFRNPPGEARVGVHPSLTHRAWGAEVQATLSAPSRPPTPFPSGWASGRAGVAPGSPAEVPTHNPAPTRPGRPFYSRDKPRPLIDSQWELSDASGCRDSVSLSFVMSQ